MSTSFAFTAGWQDYLKGLPPQAKYTDATSKLPPGAKIKKRALARMAVSMAYERGRHTAALYMIDVARRGGTINAGIAYKCAWKTMSPELKRLIREEQRYVRPKKKQFATDALIKGKK